MADPTRSERVVALAAEILNSRLVNGIKAMTDDGRPPWTHSLSPQQRLQDYLDPQKQQAITSQLQQQGGAVAVGKYVQEMESLLARQAMRSGVKAAATETVPPSINSEGIG